MECGDSSPLDTEGGDESPHSTTSGLQPTRLRNISYIILQGTYTQDGLIKRPLLLSFVKIKMLYINTNRDSLRRICQAVHAEIGIVEKFS